jgi:hypothetical protein
MVLIDIPLEQYMNIDRVEEVLNEVANCTEDYSLGFRRFAYLPDEVRRNMHVAQLVFEDNASALGAIKAFLAGLSDDEYKLWLLQQKSEI